MIIKFGTQHNVIDLMEGYNPSKGDPLQFAQSLFPNAFAAEKEFLRTWQEREVVFNNIEELHITIFIDHNNKFNKMPNSKLAKTKKGYSCAIYLGPDDLHKNGYEKSQNEIQACLEEQVEKILDRLKLLCKNYQ